MKECVKCGYCCTVGPCFYGVWNPKKGQCEYLTDDNLCSKYKEIQGHSGSKVSPAFGAGCSSSMFNERRDAKIRKDREVV
jgi:predicted molibdopterin-dependent oxidoreductase YjgC